MSDQNAAGPACDVCNAEPAVISLMQLADYSTQMLGPDCAAPFLRGVADLFDPPAPAGAPEPAPVAADTAAQAPPEAPASDDKPDPDGAAESRTAARRKAARR